MLEFSIVVVCAAAILFLILRTLVDGWASFRNSPDDTAIDDTGDDDASDDVPLVKDRAA